MNELLMCGQNESPALRIRAGASAIRRPLWAALSATVLLIAGCTVGPDYSPPEPVLPGNWGALSELDRSEPMSAPTSDPAGASLAAWWTTFNDPMLDSLVERAVQSNLDLQIAQARVREARAQRGVVAADLFPTVNTFGSYSRSRFSENSFTAGPAPGIETDLYQAGFDASWEIDVFGGVRRNVEAAEADIAASIEDRRDVLVTLLAEVAQNYVELRGFQREIEIARANLAAQRETLELTRTRLAAGLSNDLDVARAEAQVWTTESEIPALESAARQAIHRLSVLLGLSPTALLDALSSHAVIPSAPAEIPMGLPSDLLRRRPDVRRAERELAAATARIGVATADLFPRFNLVGSLGLESSRFSGSGGSGGLGDSSSRFWSIGPSVSWPILDWGRIRSTIDVESAREEQAFATYEQTILTSLREVEDALIAFLKEQARRRMLVDAVESNRRAVALATQLYEEGLSDFLSVLQAQRDLFESEDALVESERAVTTELVSLYKALGGGWEIEARAGTPPPDSSPPPGTPGAPGARRIDLTRR